MTEVNSAPMLATVIMLLAGCAGGPTVLLATPSGPVHIAGSPMPTPMVGPPPGLDPALAGAGRDGTYAGTATVLLTAGGQCIQNQQIGNFRVRGNAVRYGVFRGTIDPDGGLQMVHGRTWIIGQFDGATFSGQLDIPGRYGGPGCSYLLSLARVGP
jgi:hypothetical protein